MAFNFEKYGFLTLIGGGLSKLISIIVLNAAFSNNYFVRYPSDTNITTEVQLEAFCYEGVDTNVTQSSIWEYLSNRTLETVKAVDIFLTDDSSKTGFVCAKDEDKSYIVPTVMVLSVLVWLALRIAVYYVSREKAPNPCGCGNDDRFKTGGDLVKKYIKSVCSLPLNPIMVLNNNIKFEESYEQYSTRVTFFDTQFMSVILFGTLTLSILIIILVGTMYIGLETLDRIFCNNKAINTSVLKSLGYCFLLLALILFSVFGIFAGFIQAIAFSSNIPDEFSIPQMPDLEVPETSALITIMSSFFAVPQAPLFPDTPEHSLSTKIIAIFNTIACACLLANFFIEQIALLATIRAKFASDDTNDDEEEKDLETEVVECAKPV